MSFFNISIKYLLNLFLNEFFNLGYNHTPVRLVQFRGYGVITGMTHHNFQAIEITNLISDLDSPEVLANMQRRDTI